MFLVPPKSKSPVRQAAVGEPPARVKKACIRCRIKKIKCNGHYPCSRCEHDRVDCKIDKRDRCDLKESSRTYISSLEIQRDHLLNALRQLCRNDTNKDEVKSILHTLQARGFDIQSIDNSTEPASKEFARPHFEYGNCAPGLNSSITQAPLGENYALLTPSKLPVIDIIEMPMSHQIHPNNLSIPPFDLRQTSPENPNAQCNGFNPWATETAAIQTDSLPPVDSLDLDSCLSNLQNCMDLGSIEGVDNMHFADLWWKSWVDVSEELHTAEDSMMIPPVEPIPDAAALNLPLTEDKA